MNQLKSKCCFQALALLRHAGHVTESATIDTVDAEDVCVVTEGLRNRGGCGRTRGKDESICRSDGVERPRDLLSRLLVRFRFSSAG
jgi:hypothetical protein